MSSGGEDGPLGHVQSPGCLALRPSPLWRAVTVALAACGGLFALVGAFYISTDVAGGVLMVAFGALVLVMTTGAATSIVTCDTGELRYRYVLVRRMVRDDIVDILVQPRNGFGYPRVGIIVVLRDGRRVCLQALDAPYSPKNLARAEQTSGDLRKRLGIAG